MSHRAIALATIAAALLLAVTDGIAFAAAEHIAVWHGIYCSWMTAITVGGDVSPTNVTGYLVLGLDGTLIVPLVAATFSLMTSSLTSSRVGHQLDRHHRKILAAIGADSGET